MLSLLLVAAMGPSAAPADAGLLIQRRGANTTLAFSGGGTFHGTTASVDGARRIDVPGTHTSLAVWNERTRLGLQAYYAIALDGHRADRVTPSSYLLKLRYAEFDPLMAIPPAPPELDSSEAGEMGIVQFVTQPLPEFRDAIAAAGGVVTYYLPEHAFIVRMDAKARAAIAKLPYLRWVGDYKPAYRLDPELLAKLQQDTLGTRHYNVQVYQPGIAQKRAAADWIEAVGGTVNAIGDAGYVFEATLTPGQLRQVLHMNEVFWVDAWGPAESDMNIARDFGGANYIESTAGYKGQGVRGQVRDLGVRSTHVAFTTHPLLVRNNTTNTSHGTSTTGIVFGDGTGNASGRGMLPDAQGIFISGLPSASQRYAETLALLSSPYFGIFESNSTGSPRTRAYTTDSFTMDDILFKMNVLICQSQSNAGNQDSRPQAWAKNIVSVGGVKHLNTLTRADDNWTNGGSIGPAADGRIKPDLAHFYDSVLCPTSTSNTAYTTGFNGTSAATPIVAGHFGLLYQMWYDGVFGQTVTGTTVFDARPWNTTAKALMINTAGQWTFTGATADLTRTHQGWGAPDVRSAYDQRNKLFIVDETDVLLNLQTKSYRLYVGAGEPAFRASMVYSDPPGTTSATQHRIKDLTLKVTAPNGTVYYGNNGLLASNWSSPGGSPNTKDTVENVFVQNPGEGVWTVEVRGDEIVQDARLETSGVTDADFALVVSGVKHSVLVETMVPLTGSLLGGVLADLHTSNNQGVRVGVTTAFDDVIPVGWITITGTAPTATLANLSLRVEGKANVPLVQMRVWMRNYSTGLDQLVTTNNMSLTDGVILAVAPNASDFVNPTTRQVRAKLEYRYLNPAADNLWVATIDQARWFATP